MSFFFELPGAAEETVVARIKHMQRLNWPAGDRIGTGHRRAYGFADALRLCLAFQLADAGMSSALAVRHLKGGRTLLSSAFDDAKLGKASVPIIVMAPFALNVDSGTESDGRSSILLLPRGARVPRPGPQPHRPRIHLDPVETLSRLKLALKTLQGISSDEVERAAGAFDLAA